MNFLYRFLYFLYKKLYIFVDVYGRMNMRIRICYKQQEEIRRDKMNEVLILNQEEVKEILHLEKAIELVEECYTEFNENKSVIYPAVRETVDEHEGIFGIKSSYLIDDKMMGLKAGGFWKNNMAHNQKMNHQSTMVLFNAETGEPTCLLDANHITITRTAAAGTVAAKHLAKKDSQTVAIIGSGVQAKVQLSGLLHQFSIKKVYVYSQATEAAEQWVTELITQGISAENAKNAQEAVVSADIVVTTTPSYTPVIKTSWLKEGAHVNAIGSDTKGKNEVQMDKSIDKVVCDLWEQSSIMGELQHGFAKESLYAEIGEITGLVKKGRETDEEVTMFDSTGISVQDMKVAAYVYKQAKKEGIGQKIKL
jgi:alanine dehydrogenase